MAILTIDDLKTRYEIRLSNDNELQELLEVAQERCFAYAGITQGPVEEYFNGGARAYALTYGPVREVEKVEVAGASLPWRLNRRASEVILLNGPAPGGLDAVKVSYECGWMTSEDAPRVLRAAVALTVQHLLKLINTKQAGITSRQIEGGAEQIEQQIPTIAVKCLLDQYRTGVL